MRITPRDVRLLRDLALSQVLTRDDIIALRYFNTPTRVNTRLRELMHEGLVKRLTTPFFGQSIYSASRSAAEIIGESTARLLRSRTGSPRLIQHCLTVNRARVRLLQKGATWRFEQQLWTTFEHRGKRFEVRPDGMAIHGSSIAVLEVDLGHASLPKIAAKLRGFEQFIDSGTCEARWQCPSFTLLLLTTGPSRKQHLQGLCVNAFPFRHRVETFADFGVQVPGCWS